MKSTFVQLAHTYNPKKHFFEGWVASEKLDGMRAVWVPQSRGFYVWEVPWANIDKSTQEQKNRRSTGLWSRLGKPIFAPDHWVQFLPDKAILDMELWTGRGQFQTITSIVRTQDGSRDQCWNGVKAMCFDVIPAAIFFADRDVSETMYKKQIRCEGWSGSNVPTASAPFETRYKILLGLQNQIVTAHAQYRLSSVPSRAKEEVDRLMEDTLARGGEGLMLKDPFSPYVNERCHTLIKLKPFSDMEATVIGYQTGRATDLGSKLLGKMGALILKSDTGKVFKVSGFTDEERVLAHKTDRHDSVDQARQWAAENPDADCPDWITNPKFPRGSRVTIKYRELSDDGIAKEARYFRKREE